MEKKLNIGVLVDNLESEYCKELTMGINHAAAELNHNIIIFTGMMVRTYDNLNIGSKERQSTLIFDIADRMNLDVLVISLGTVSGYAFNRTFSDIEFLQQFKDLPVLVLESNVPGYPSITIDNKNGMRDCMEHLILNHGYKNIAFVSGPQNNFDALEREKVYFECMAEHNLPVDSSMFARGDFTPRCSRQVGEIIDSNPNLDAIVFANDEMASSGYVEINRRGLIVGQDIAVTGFDDSLIAQTMDPPLTTVRVNTYNLGYNAIYEAERLFLGKEIIVKSIGSEFIERSSCGGARHGVANAFDSLKSTDDNFVADVSRIIVSYCLVHSCNIEMSLGIYNLMLPLVDYIYYSYVKNQYEDKSFRHIRKYIRIILNSNYADNISIDSFQKAINEFIKKIWLDVNDATKLDMMFLLNDINMFITHYYYTTMKKQTGELKMGTWISNHITRDTLIHDNSDENVFADIFKKMIALGIGNSYLYLFDSPVTCDKIINSPSVNFISLKCCNTDSEIQVFEDGSQNMPLCNMISNKYIDPEVRHSLVIFSLFMNEEQHGFFVVECDLEKYTDAYYASLQLCSAVKYLYLVRQKNEIQKKLSDSNLLLKRQSNSDELTTVLNRRGFLAELREIIDESMGKNAVMLYCDIDNLKSINDFYGHSEGDFAIKSVAKILKTSVRAMDIIGRMGGDEFTIFTISDDNSDAMLHIRDRIARNCKEFNLNCQKPYYIDVSVGAIPFVCGRDVNINDIISCADSDLYNVKKNKRKNVRK